MVRGFGALKGVALALIALGLLVRVAVPTGFMPSAEAGQRFVLVACPDAGPVAAPSAHHHGDHDKSKKKSGFEGGHCAFSSAGFAWAAFTLPDLVPVALVADRQPLAILSARIGQGLAAPPPPSTGPPILS